MEVLLGSASTVENAAGHYQCLADGRSGKTGHVEVEKNSAKLNHARNSSSWKIDPFCGIFFYTEA